MLLVEQLLALKKYGLEHDNTLSFAKNANANAP
jgi:hypothetical protein